MTNDKKQSIKQKKKKNKEYEKNNKSQVNS